MTNRQLKNIRYVKCPRCTRILPEPEQASLYTCGGCNTVLQAKNYTGSSEASKLTSRTEDVVQSNGNGHDFEVGDSSGSSQRSSSGEQSSNQNEEIDRNTVDDCNFEQIGAENSAHHTSLSEESGVLETEGGKQIIGQSNGDDHAFEAGESSGFSGEDSDEKAVGDSNSEQIRTESCANHTSLSEQPGVLESIGGGEAIVSQGESGEAVEIKANSSSGVSPYRDHTIAGDKESGKLSTEIKAIEDGTYQDQYDGVAAENQDDEHIRNDNDTCKTSTSGEFEVLKNRKSEQLVKEASMSILSQRTETATQLGKEDSTDTVPGDEITSLVANRSVVAKLGKEDDSGKQQTNFIERKREELPSVTNSSDIPTPTEATQNGNENSLPGAEGAYGNQSASDFSSGSERSASGVLQDPASEISLSNSVKETSRKKMEDIDNSVFHESGQNRSTDEPETSELVDTRTDEKVDNLLKEVPRSPTKSSLAYDRKPETSEPVNTHGKIGNSLKEIQQSPTKRSFAYDGSVSSWDGNDDQVTEQPNLDGEVFSENDAAAGYDVPKPNRRKYSNWRTQGQVKGSSSQVLDEKLKSSMVEDEESVRENDIRRHTRMGHLYCRDGLFPPRIPVNTRSSELEFETGSSSSYVHGEPSSHRTRNHLYRYEDQEPWRRQTYEKRGYMDGRRVSEAALRQNDLLPMYNDDLSGEIYHKPRYHGYRDRRRGTESWSLSANLPQIRHSGEVYNGRYQIDEHYMQRHPDGRGWSAQLPSGPTRVIPAAYYRQAPMTYLDPLRETSWEPYDTYPSNFRRFLDLQSYAWADDTGSLSDDQRHTDWIRKKSYIRERRQAVKRHVRPKAGGAPFITCHFCFTVLQLPEEFLLSKRRKTHWLKCGACSNVLEYSLENESCLAPRLPYTGEGTESNLDRDVRSPSHASLSQQSVFVSEEAHRHGRDLLKHNSSKSLGREKSKLMSRNSRNGERLDESDDTAESSDQSKQVKVTWQLPARSKSPLHRLMGYSSAQDLLTARGASDVE